MAFSEEKIEEYIKGNKVNLMSLAVNQDLSEEDANQLENSEEMKVLPKAPSQDRNSTFIEESKPEEEGLVQTSVEVTGLSPESEDAFWANRDYSASVRRNLNYQYSQLASFDAAFGNRLEALKHSKDTVDTERANNMLKEWGVNIKVDKPTTVFDLYTIAQTKIKKDYLEESIAKANATGSLGAVRNAMVVASAFAGAVGPLELTGAIGTAFVPVLGVSALAKGASAVNTALKVKRISDVSRATQTLRNAATLLETTASAEGQAGQIAAAMLRKSPEVVKASRTLDFWRGVKAAKKLKYDSLSWREKTLLDALVFSVYDAPLASYKRFYSTDTLQFDLYSEQDKALETLTALSFGTFIPGSLRFVGNKLGISPSELKLKTIRDAKMAVSQQVAVNSMSSEAGKIAHAALDKMERTITEGTAFKYHPRLLRAAEQLKQANVSNKTLITQLEFINNCIMNDIPIQLHMIPEFESILSSIDASILRRVYDGEGIDKVFGSNIVRAITKEGFVKLAIHGEYGLLGSRSIMALSETQGLAMMESLYKGIMHGASLEDGAPNVELSKFLTFAKRMKRMATDFREIIDRWDETLIKAKNKNEKFNFVNLRHELREAYRRAVLGEDVARQQARIKQENVGAKSLGFEEVATPELDKADEMFDEFFSKIGTVETRKSKSGKEFEVVYLLDKDGVNSGRTKGMRNFRDFVEDLNAGADDNLYLADLDNVLFDIERERLEQMKNYMMGLETASDPGILAVLGIQRKNFTTLLGESRDKQMMDSVLAQQRIEYNKVMNGGEYADAVKILKDNSVVDKSIGSSFTRAVDLIESVRATKAEGFGNFRQQVLEKLQKSDSFVSNVTNIIKTSMKGEKVEWNIALEFVLSDSIKAALKDLNISKHLSDTMLSRVVKETVETFKNAAIEDPRILDSLMDKETLNKIYIESNVETGALSRDSLGKDVKTVYEGDPSFEENLARSNAERVVNQNEIFKPLEDALDLALTNAELTEMHNVKVAASLMVAMKASPGNAAEVLTGAATQTMMQFKSSARSVEAKVQIVGYYLKDMKKTLSETESSTGGRTLWDVYTTDSNAKQGVNEARVKLKYGEEYQENSDYARIAEIMSEYEASMLNEFKKYGLIYTDQSVPLDLSKLKYMDAAMTDQDIEHLGSLIDEAFDIDVDGYLDTLDVDGMNTVKSGNTRVDKGAKLKESIEKDIKEMVKELKDLFAIGNNIHKKMALYIFRACDLDKMFVGSSIRKVSLNKVRDAILSGNLVELFEGDVYKVKEVKRAVKEITSKIIGPKRSKKKGLAAGRYTDEQGAVVVSAGSKVFTLRTGMNNLAAVVTGAKSAAFDEFEGSIFFKNSQEELNALNMFGYNTLEDQMKATLTKQARALYSFENFGSDPVRMVTELVDTYNTAIKKDNTFREYLRDLAKKSRKKMTEDESATIADKYQIHESAKKSVIENTIFACGLQNSAPTAVTRVIRAFKTLLSVPLLALAGVRSISDTGTMTSQLMLNAMASSRTEAYAVQMEALKILTNNKDCLDLFLGASLIENEDFLKLMLNDPTVDLSKLSDAATGIDKLEKFASAYGDFFMNKLGLMAPITNSNKQVAALAIQLSVAKFSDIGFADLPLALREALLRDGINEFEWDFIRTHMVRDLGEYTDNLKGRMALVDQSIMDTKDGKYVISDEVIHKALHEQGYLNITPETIREFRTEMLNKVWCLTDRGADEMISVPSGRVMQWMRGGQPRNSVLGTFMEILTQFNSFGASMAYYNYGRYLSKVAGRETGLTALDIFNPNVALKNTTRSRVMLGAVGMFSTIALNMLAVDTLVNAMRGNIQVPWDDRGLHVDNYISSALGALGTIGTVIDMVWEGVEGAGQRGGGFSIHAAPSVANMLRVAYRLGKPLTSSKIEMEDKPGAFGAALVQEFARATGAKSLPLAALVWQDWFGAWLDMRAYGGEENYENYIRGRERRGQVIMPWEENPQPLWERF